MYIPLVVNIPDSMASNTKILELLMKHDNVFDYKSRIFSIPL